MNVNLTDKQWEALTTEGNEILYGGAAGAGKSYLMRMLSILYSLRIPGLQTYLFRRRYNDLTQNHLFGPSGYLTLLDPWVKAGKVAVNMSDNRIDFFHPGEKTSSIYLRHVHHEKDMYNYQGAEIHLLLIDELTHFQKSIYTFLRTRVRLGSFHIDYDDPRVRNELPWVRKGDFPMILAGTNPGNIGHAWVKRAWIDPRPPGEVWKTPREEGGMNRVFISARLTDNFHLLREDPNYAERLLGSGKMAKALLEGSWDIAEGGAFEDCWTPDVVIPPIEIPDGAKIYRAMDWGSYHPYAVVWAMLADGSVYKTLDGDEIHFPRGSVIVIKELYGWNGEENVGSKKPAYDVGKQIAQIETENPWGKKVRKGPADIMIFAKRGGDTETIESHITRGYNDYIESLFVDSLEDRESWQKSLLEGKKKASSLFTRADQSPNSRVQGLEIMRMFLFAVKNGDDKKGLYVSQSCHHLIRTIPTLPRDEHRPEDIDTDAEDHLYDALRYLLMENRTTISRMKVSGL